MRGALRYFKNSERLCNVLAMGNQLDHRFVHADDLLGWVTG